VAARSKARTVFTQSIAEIVRSNRFRIMDASVLLFCLCCSLCDRLCGLVVRVRQSSWLQIRRPGFDSRHYRKKSRGSGTGSTQPREYNWEATW
jgi:hypothetical protein